MDLTAGQEQAYFADAMGDVLGMNFGDASDYSGKPTLGPGDSGSSVSDLQRLLITVYGPGSLGSWGPNKDGVDGSFGRSGSDTHNKVKQFQAANGLASTGTVDTATWAKLYESGSGATKEEKTANTIGSIFSALTQGIQAFGPMIGPKQDYTTTGGGPPTPGPVVQAPAKSFPWGTVAIVGVGGLILVGGLIFVMKR